MYIRSKPILSLDSVLSIPDIENRVFSFYIPEYRSGAKVFKSPFRAEQTGSSYIVDIRGTLFFKDFGDNSCLNFYMFVRKLYNCDFSTALAIINRDLNLGFHTTVNCNCERSDNILKVGTPSVPDTVILRVKKRDWTADDVNYWGKYGVTVDMLVKYNVYPISHYFIDKSYDAVLSFKADKLAYSLDFYWCDNVFRRKIYQPYSKNKWYSNINNTVVQGIKALPRYGEKLIITKSLKDVICFSEVLNIPSIATNSESSFIPIEVFEKLQKRFSAIYICFDNDNTGEKFSSIYAEQYNLKRINIPKIARVKDISDLLEINKTRVNEVLSQIA